MRAAIVFAVAAVVASRVVATGQPADRVWQTGTWVSENVTAAGPARGRTAVREYVVDAADARYDVQDTATPTAAAPKVVPGASVVFAVEEDVFYVREDGHAERRLRLVKTTRKLRTYGAAGPGHFVRAIGEGGQTVTLEDGSVWDVDPRTAFKVGEWEPLAGITVHSTEEDPDFNYILNDTDEDDWTFVTLAKGPA